MKIMYAGGRRRGWIVTLAVSALALVAAVGTMAVRGPQLESMPGQAQPRRAPHSWRRAPRRACRPARASRPIRTCRPARARRRVLPVPVRAQPVTGTRRAPRLPAVEACCCGRSPARVRSPSGRGPTATAVTSRGTPAHVRPRRPSSERCSVSPRSPRWPAARSLVATRGSPSATTASRACYQPGPRSI